MPTGVPSIFTLYFEDFLTVLLPLLVAVGGGWILGNTTQVPASPLSLVGMNLLGPALLLAHIPYSLNHQARLLLLVLLSTGCMLFIAFLIGSILFPSLNENERRGFILGASLANFGFFGLPLVRLALPPEAEELAFILIAFLNIPTGIIAAWIAAPPGNFPRVFKEVFRLPFVWAVIVTLLFGYLKWKLPSPLVSALSFCGESAVPLMLVVLGIELARVPLKTYISTPVLVAALLRLFIFPALTWLLARLLELPPLAQKTVVLQLATPTGVTSLLYFSLFGRDTRLIAAITLITTLLAFFVLPFWLPWIAP